MSTNSSSWITCCGQMPRNQIVFLVQVFIAYVVIIVSLVNITFTSENTCLWTTLASGTIGYLLPSPSIKRHESFLRDTPV
jgi:hypothetical protein